MPSWTHLVEAGGETAPRRPSEGAERTESELQIDGTPEVKVGKVQSGPGQVTEQQKLGVEGAGWQQEENVAKAQDKQETAGPHRRPGRWAAGVSDSSLALWAGQQFPA